jgi:hypothetical protein
MLSAPSKTEESEGKGRSQGAAIAEVGNVLLALGTRSGAVSALCEEAAKAGMSAKVRNAGHQ